MNYPEVPHPSQQFQTKMFIVPSPFYNLLFCDGEISHLFQVLYVVLYLARIHF